MECQYFLFWWRWLPDSILLVSVYQEHSQFIGRTFQATARFQDSDIFQKAIKMVLMCILSVNYHFSRVKLYSGPTHVNYKFRKGNSYIPVKQREPIHLCKLFD